MARSVSGQVLSPETKGHAGACPDRTRAIPCKVRAVAAEVSVIRKGRGMISADVETSDRVQAGRVHKFAR